MRGLIEKSYISDIASAIRSKTGKSDKIKPSEMAREIANIPQEGGSSDKIRLLGTYTITSSGVTVPLDDILDKYGDDVTTDNFILEPAGTQSSSVSTATTATKTIYKYRTQGYPIFRPQLVINRDANTVKITISTSSGRITTQYATSSTATTYSTLIYAQPKHIFKLYFIPPSLMPE